MLKFENVATRNLRGRENIYQGGSVRARRGRRLHKGSSLDRLPEDQKLWKGVKFEWLQYPAGHLSVCRLRLKKSLVPVADCCQGPLNMWKNLWVWNKNVNLLIPSWDRWEEEFFSHPGRQLKLLLDDGWKCGKCRSIRCGELDCPESLGNFISKEPNIYILKTIHLLRTGKDAGINFPPVKQHFEEIKLLLI